MNYYNEFDPKAAAWLRQLIEDGLIPWGIVDERSIAEVQPDDLHGFVQCHFFAGLGGWPRALQLAGWPADRPVWTGSCPCQPYSDAGKRLGDSDERNLWPVFRDLIAQCRPDVVFGEQVASKAGYLWFASVRADLERCRYAATGVDLPAACVGAPHQRQRIFWIADSGGQRSQGCAIAAEGQRASGHFSAWRPIAGAPFQDPSGGSGHAHEPRPAAVDDGIPARLARVAIQGFGNAIVPQVAAEFIMAADEAVAYTE